MKKIAKVLLLFLFCLTLFACGKKASYNGADKGGVNSNPASDSAKIVVDDDRKIIYNVSYVLEAKDIKSYQKKIEGKLNELTGYIETLDTRTYYSTCVYRVPKANLDTFVQYIDSFDGLTNDKSIKTEDISSSYNSYQARKEVLEASRTSYVKMLEDDTLSVHDIIEINDKIEKIDVELREIYLQLDTYGSLVDYSTVTVHYYEKGEYSEPTFFSEYAEYISDFFITIGKVILYLLPFAAIGGVAAVITIASIKHHNKKKRENNENKNNDNKEE
ncbi:MAG: DUF4349 domain-containing protein [bacterium]|nr:DUF4349 domain-containing protein [bacterium]